MNGKGDFRGYCNRRACSSVHTEKNPIEWFNSSTHKFYCPVCATMINNANDDLEDDLCNKVEICPVCKGSGESPTHPGEPCCGCNGKRIF